MKSSSITEDVDSDTFASQAETVESQSDKEVEEDMEEIKISINDIEVVVEWEDNESVDALKNLLKTGDMTIHMSMYGGG